MKHIKLIVILLVSVLFLQCKDKKKEEAKELISEIEALCFNYYTKLMDFDIRSDFSTPGSGDFSEEQTKEVYDKHRQSASDGYEECRNKKNDHLELIETEGIDLDSLITEYISIIEDYPLKYFLNDIIEE